MKTLKLFTKPLLLLVIAGVTLGSCSKGEQGETGPKGEQGSQGEKGIAGPDGSTVLNGTVVPAATLGKTGDFYINTATSIIYGPKTATSWGAGKSILGAQGTPGSKILSGTAAPAATIGATGDYYLDKTSYSLYGPKTSTGWGVALSLKGTANVIYSGWNTAINLRDTIIDGSAVKARDLLAPSLSNALVNTSNMQVYFSFGTGVFPLPYSSYAGGKLNIISYISRPQRFIITRFTTDNTNTTSLPAGLQYRYVIIPGGSAVSVAKKINMNNYEEVKKAYNIPD